MFSGNFAIFYFYLIMLILKRLRFETIRKKHLVSTSSKITEVMILKITGSRSEKTSEIQHKTIVYLIVLYKIEFFT